MSRSHVMPAGEERPASEMVSVYLPHQVVLRCILWSRAISAAIGSRWNVSGARGAVSEHRLHRLTVFLVCAALRGSYIHTCIRQWVEVIVLNVQRCAAACCCAQRPMQPNRVACGVFCSLRPRSYFVFRFADAEPGLLLRGVRNECPPRLPAEGQLFEVVSWSRKQGWLSESQ